MPYSHMCKKIFSVRRLRVGVHLTSLKVNGLTTSLGRNCSSAAVMVIVRSALVHRCDEFRGNAVLFRIQHYSSLNSFGPKATFFCTCFVVDHDDSDLFSRKEICSYKDSL